MSSEGQKTNKSETGLLLGYQTICYARQSGQIRQQNMSLSADTVDIVNQGRRQFQTKKPDSDSGGVNKDAMSQTYCCLFPLQ